MEAVAAQVEGIQASVAPTMPWCKPAGDEPASFRGTTLVLPCVSIGSVPQLGVDLLVQAPQLHFRRVAFLDASDCVPFVSPAEPGSGDAFCTALDVYQSPLGITAVQQRSPVIRSQKEHFAKQLAAWIQDAQFAQVLVLTSMDAALRTDKELPLTFVSLRPRARDVPSDAPLVHRVSTAFPAFAPPHTPEDAVPPVPGGGVTRTLLEHLPANSVALAMFCAEGENRPDAHALIGQVAKLLQLPLAEPLAEPPSWRTVYGEGPNPMLYG